MTSHRHTNVLISAIKTSNGRMRKINQEKVKEISESIDQLGILLQPIVIDKNNKLISGLHRLEAFKLLKKDKISVKIIDFPKLKSTLAEIDENLKRNELNKIEVGEHLVKRDELLEKMGLRTQVGDNQYSTNGSEESCTTTQKLSNELGIHKRTYYQLKQISKNIDKETKELLKETKVSDNLDGLLSISKTKPDIQVRVGEILSERDINVSNAITQAENEKLITHPPSVKDSIDLKEEFGQQPASLMSFSRKNDELEKLISLVDMDSGLKKVRGNVWFNQSPHSFSTFFPQRCKFYLSYYTRKNDLILDPFMGRGTRSITTLWLKRKYVGFDSCPDTTKLNQKIIKKHLPKVYKNSTFHCDDGTKLEPYKNKKDLFDGVITCPPWFKGPEKYSGLNGDLSYKSTPDFMKSIDEMFVHLSRLIKKSNYEKKKFYPVIITIGTSRDGKDGMLDMDYEFQHSARKSGFTLWDKRIDEVRNSSLRIGWSKKYESKYVPKNHETTLIWIHY
jgi:ParB family transcriptional regulator, chromosome partitioning protein